MTAWAGCSEREDCNKVCVVCEWIDCCILLFKTPLCCMKSMCNVCQWSDAASCLQWFTQSKYKHLWLIVWYYNPGTFALNDDSVYWFFSNSGLLLFGFIYIVLMSNMIRFHVAQLWYCVVIGRWIHVQFIADIDCTLMWYEWERVWVHVGFDVVLCAINKYILIHT